jgi:hypothetical protein
LKTDVFFEGNTLFLEVNIWFLVGAWCAFVCQENGDCFEENVFLLGK